MADRSTRRSAEEIYEVVTQGARSELERSTLALAFSGLAGGLVMGLSAFGVATIRAAFGESEPAKFASFLLYPLGFVAVIVGRSQLFTENTVYPVALVLKERAHVGNTLRLWAAVFLSNVLGALAFSALAIETPALEPSVREQLGKLGMEAASHPLATVFWSGVMGGWLIALVAWTVTASHWTIGQVAMVYLLTFVVGSGHFAHCIAGSAEVLSAVLRGEVSAGGYLAWLGAAACGNVLGGVLIVTLLNYAQVHAPDDPT